MTPIRTTIVLGAHDPEMAAIEAAATAAEWTVLYASYRDPSGLRPRERVSPSGAYDAHVEPARLVDGVFRVVSVYDPELRDCTRLVLVECSVLVEDDVTSTRLYQGAEHVVSVVRVDHHRPGDRGYGRPPEEALEASSLGQVLTLIANEPSPRGSTRWTAEQRVIAAADHCLAAAYAGRVPGVTAGEVLAFRSRSRSAFLGMSLHEYDARVNRATKAILEAPRVALARVPIGGEDGDSPVAADLRGLPGGTIDEAPEASARLGTPVLALSTERGGRKKKVVLLGDEEGSAVRAFLGGWAAEAGLTGVCGDPARGFAGGWIPRRAPPTQPTPQEATKEDS